MSQPNVRVRFAPSPTGYLHVGGARTALYNWLYAQSVKGQFVLRIEDTDRARSTEEALRLQLHDLKWLGLHWNEGPDVGGPYGPYKQSERLSIYQEHAQRLVDSKKAYHCFCSDERLEQVKQEKLSQGLPPHYDGTCRSLSLEEAQSRISKGEKAVVRFRIPTPHREYVLDDIIRQEVKFPSEMVGDFVILRSDGMPVYNFSCAIDDATMKITHVLRAEEHLSNSLRQLMIYEAFDYTPPRFGHLSIILGADRQKLSKRHGATSVYEYYQKGYLPEALNNFIALLGWSSPEGKEVMSIEEMISQFNLDRFNSAAAVFDETKLKWMNSVHLRALDHKELWRRLKPILENENLNFEDDSDWIDRSLSAFKTSMETLNDGIELFRPLADNQYQITEEGKPVAQSGRAVIEKWLALLKELSVNYLEEESFLQIQDQVMKECSVKGKDLFQPLRVAVVGRPQGVELKKLAPLLKRKSLMVRAEKCLSQIG